MIYKTLHRKLNFEQHDPTKTRDELRCSERVAVLAPIVTPVMLL